MRGIDLHRDNEQRCREPYGCAQDHGEDDGDHAQESDLAAGLRPVAVLSRACDDLGGDFGQTEVQHRHHPAGKQQPRDDDEAELGHPPGPDDQGNDRKAQQGGHAESKRRNHRVLDQALDH